jgi:hypothetical protein
MAGGLLSLVSQGQQNIILNSNPSKTFFKSAYAHTTNFGLQKFRVEFEGSKTLQLTEQSVFTFKIPRYAELLMDCYLSIDLPNIWSPIFPPSENEITGTTGVWSPYEFKWIENIGALMISNITITCGNQTLQQFSGNYLLSAAQRDFSGEKLALFNQMIGNIPELNDPANAFNRRNMYPNAFYTEAYSGPEPSIRGRTLYVPLNSWFQYKTQMAFPLVALQYNELHINVTFRPINQMFQIRDIMDSVNNYPYVAPNFNIYYMQMYRFLQPPPDQEIGFTSYADTRSVWNPDIHLNCTYCFLSNDESRMFALNEQVYLFKQVYEQSFFNVTGANKVQVNSISMVADWMFYFQRSDANVRNEWSNYTNWPYKNVLPSNVVLAPSTGTFPINITDEYGNQKTIYIGPGENPDGTQTDFFLSGQYNIQNEPTILTDLGILFDGDYRENMQPEGVYNFIEKYVRTAGNAPDGLYCYNFCLNTSPFDLQPSGATNMSRFNKIELEFNTLVPPANILAQTLSICDPETSNVIGVNKPSWDIYLYNYNLYVMEERINQVIFVSGNCGLLYAN